MFRFVFLSFALLGFLVQFSLAKTMPRDFLNNYCTQCHGEEKQKAAAHQKELQRMAKMNKVQ